MSAGERYVKLWGMKLLLISATDMPAACPMCYHTKFCR